MNKTRRRKRHRRPIAVLVAPNLVAIISPRPQTPTIYINAADYAKLRYSGLAGGTPL